MTKISFKRAFSLLFAFACVFSTLLFTSCGECEHVWDEGKVAKEPTDTQEGAMIYTCLECQEQRYEAIKKLSHNPKSHTYDKAIWGKDSTYHWLICDHPDCDATTGKAHHSLTANPNGGYMCQVCKNTVDGHTFSNNVMDCTDKLHWVKCDDKDCEVIAHYNVHNWEYTVIDEVHHLTSCAKEGCPLNAFPQEHTLIDGENGEKKCQKCEYKKQIEEE